MSALAVDVLADLRGVVRIAKAASIGVTGNTPRIERAERAIDAFAELLEADKAYDQVMDELQVVDVDDWNRRAREVRERRDAALVRCGGASRAALAKAQP